MKIESLTSYRFGLAWLAMCFAFTLHWIDEALNDFLSIYNPTAEKIREATPWLPLPTWTFPVWLGSLMAASIVLFLLSPFAFRRHRWIRAFSYLFAILMIANALGHTAGSFALGRPMAGVYSSPLLFIASVFLLREASRADSPRRPLAPSPTRPLA